MPSFRVNAKWAALTEVASGLYVCGVSALKTKTLNELDISLIVNCTSEVPNLSSMGRCERVKLWLEDCDDVDLLSHLDPVTDHIRFALSSGGRALVHCQAGVSRSTAFCLAYLMKYESLSLRQAYRLMAARRPMVRPNLGFWKQLIEYERLLQPGKSPSVSIVPVAGGREYLPDVYVEPIKEADKENDDHSIGLSINIDLLAKRRHSSGCGRVKFVPRLASVPEN